MNKFIQPMKRVSNKSSIRNNDVTDWVLVIIILFTSWTVYFKLPFIPIWNLIGIVLIYKKYKLSLNRIHPVSFLFIVLVLMRIAIPTYSNLHLTSLISYFVNSIMLLMILLIDNISARKIFIKLVKLLSTILVIGLVFHILMLLNIYSFKVFTIVDYDFRYFEVYFWGSSYQGGDFARFSSIFDEPGFLGTISAFILVINKLDLSKRSNIIVFIAGLFSFSLAFYILLGLYLFYFAITNFRSNIATLIIGVIIVVLIFNTFNLSFERKIIDRLFYSDEIVSGSIRGVSNTNNSIGYLMSQNSMNLLFGNGLDSYKESKVDYINNSSWPRLVYQIGLFFTLLLFIALLLLGVSNSGTFLFICLFILSIYQRPQIFNLLIFFLLSIGIRNNYEKKYKFNVI